MAAMQDRRSRKTVPGGRRLHDYVNLYLNARNTMLFKVIKQYGRDAVCVLRISPDVLDIPQVALTDCNAASDHVRFAPSPEGLVRIDKDYLFSRYWTHPEDQIATWRPESAMCAEMLVPDVVLPDLIVGIYVAFPRQVAALSQSHPTLPVAANGYLFFL